MRYLILRLSMLVFPLMIACSNEGTTKSTTEHLSYTEQINQFIQNVISDPSQLPVAFISCVGVLTFLFMIWREVGLLYSILDAFIVVGLGALIISPIFYQASEPELTITTVAMGGTALIGGLLVRISYGLNRYLAAKTAAANRANRPPPSDEDDD